MTEQEHQDAITAALAALNGAVAAARADEVTVNLWVTGTGPTNTGPSEYAVDFGGA